MNTEAENDSRNGNGVRSLARVVKRVTPTLARSGRLLAVALAAGLLAGTAGVARAAISVTATTNSGWVAAAKTNDLAFSFTPAANGILVVTIGVECDTGAANGLSVASVTWIDSLDQTFPLTLAKDVVTSDSNGNDVMAAVYYLANPADGDGTIRATFTSANAINRSVVGAIYATGTGVPGAWVSAYGNARNDITVGPIPVKAGDLVVNAASYSQGPFDTTGCGIVGGGDTQLYNPQDQSGSGAGASYIEAASDTSYKAFWQRNNLVNQQRVAAAIVSFSANAPKFLATGGDGKNNHTVNGQTYAVHVFTTGGTFTPSRNLALEYLIVAGGGGGGSRLRAGGGGGAGGLLTGNVAVTAQSYPVIVGSGGGGGGSSGYAQGTDGTASTVFGITTAGGGGGGAAVDFQSFPSGRTGGSGGGVGAGGTDNSPGSPGSGTAGQGYAGGGKFFAATDNRGGGGGGGAGGVGGAGATGNIGGARGAGVVSTLSGSSVTYATGGRGGGISDPASVASGAVSTGDGGGGASTSSNAAGGNGGSGIVVIRYNLLQPTSGTILLLR